MKSSRTRKGLVVLALLLLLLSAAGLLARLRADRQLARVKDLRNQLAGPAGRQLTREQRREGWQRLRKEVQRLSPAQRRMLFDERRKQQRERLAKFFKLSPEERLAELDRRIDRMEAMRQQWEARRAARDSGRSPDGAGNGSGAGGTSTGTATNGPGGPPPWRGRPRSDEERNQRRKEWLARTTPEERAQRAEYFKLLAQRREQRGLPPLTFGPRR
jgi:hypothetical protein